VVGALVVVQCGGVHTPPLSEVCAREMWWYRGWNVHSDEDICLWRLRESSDRYKHWVKKSMKYEVEGARPRGRPKKTWRLWKKTDRHIN